MLLLDGDVHTRDFPEDVALCLMSLICILIFFIDLELPHDRCEEQELVDQRCQGSENHSRENYKQES